MARDGGSLPLQRVLCVSRRGHPAEFTVLWDTGASINLVTRETANRLKLVPRNADVDVTVAGGSTRRYYEVADLRLCDMNGISHSLTALIVDHITKRLQSTEPATAARAFNTAADVFEKVSGKVDLLLGTSVAGLHPAKHRVAGNLVWARNSFGTGNICFGSGSTVSTTVLTTVAAQHRAADFLTAEGLGTEKTAQCPSCAGCRECSQRARMINYKEAVELQLIERGLTFRTKQRRWWCQYPVTADFERLSNNKAQVMKLNEKLMQRLQKTGDLDHFNAQFADAVKRGVFRRLEAGEEREWSGTVHYISFQVAYKEGSSTPLRICQNSAIPFKGLSLNDCFYKGPPALNSLWELLVSWRLGPTAVVGDISKFYNSVDSCDRDRHARRLLWREGPTAEWQTYTTDVVSFGDRPAGCVVTTALRLTAKRMAEQYPAAARALCERVYVDDVIDSEENRASAQQLADDMDAVAKDGGFSFKNFTFSGDDSPATKVLGLCWNPKDDTLYPDISFNCGRKVRGRKEQEDLRLEDVENEIPNPISKRRVWGMIMGVFDPLGLLAPLTVKLKLCLLEANTLEKDKKVGWDDPVDPDVRRSLVKAVSEIATAQKMTFPRCVKPAIGGELTLAVFVDAATNACCALVYTRYVQADGTAICQLLTAKTRVSKASTIPRQELCAAVLGTRLAVSAREALKTDCQMDFFTDSSAVLGMLRADSGALNTYAGSRSAEVAKKTAGHQWRWIRSDENPADLGTRGKAAAADVAEGSRYRCGPDWLSRPRTTWPGRTDFRAMKPPPEEEVARAAVNVAAVETAEPDAGELFKVEDYSSMKHLIKIVCICMRFIRKIRFGREAPEFNKQQARNWLIARDQKANPVDVSKLKAYNPCEKEIEGPTGLTHKLLTVSTRSPDVSAFIWDYRWFPVVADGSPIAALVARDTHMEHHFDGLRTWAAMRRRLHAVNGRRVAEKMARRCVTCIKKKAANQYQRMAGKNRDEVVATPSWTHLSADICGPFQVHGMANKRTRAKVWILVICCKSTKACSLIMLSDLTAEECARAFGVHCFRHGQPRTISSDGGTQLVACRAAFVKALPDLTWTISPAATPHYNGTAERTVGLVKRLMVKRFHGTVFAQSEWNYVLAAIESALNTRPIGGLNEQGVPLTPNHVIMGRSTTDSPQLPVEEVTLKQRSKLVDETLRQWWREWWRVGIPEMLAHRKWTKERDPPKIGEVVYITTPTGGRHGVVEELHASDDGLVRSITVRTRAPGEKTFRVTHQGIQNVIRIQEEEA